MSSTVETNVRPDPDELIQKFADYVHDYKITNDQAISTAKYCLMDTIGCGLLACLLYTSPSPRDRQKSRMPSSA